MWILATLLGIILFFIVLLAIPIDLRFFLEKEDNLRSQARVEWLYGLIGKDIKFKKEKAKPKKKKKRKRKWKGNIRPFLALVRTKGFVRQFIRFLKGIRRTATIRELKLDIRIGLDDPADTAMLFAAIAPATFFVDHFSPVDTRVRPDFEHETFRGRFSGDLRVVPIKFIKPTLLFAFSPTTLRAVKSMVMAYRK
ncbi:MAG: DUF2953 domain-containing protein [Chloroflexi bacterium]|nr:DUF2953 domain-containing protein [Chloroflexota bacterium]